MWIIVLVAFFILSFVLSGIVSFALDPVGSTLNFLRVASFMLAGLTGGAMFLFGAPFELVGWTFVVSATVWVLLLFIPNPRLRY